MNATTHLPLRSNEILHQFAVLLVEAVKQQILLYVKLQIILTVQYCAHLSSHSFNPLHIDSLKQKLVKYLVLDLKRIGWQKQ